MPTIRSHGLRPMTHAVLAALCFTLPACIQDVIVPPPDDNPPVVDGGPTPDPVRPPDNEQSVYYDPLTFAGTIQVDLDVASCSVTGCHDSFNRLAGFFLHPAPSFGSIEMWSNLQSVTSRVDLSVSSFVAEDSLFYLRATDNHAGSVVPNPAALRDWLDAARARYPRTGGSFDADVFERLIQPSLDDSGCTTSGCHDSQTRLPFPLFPRPAPGSVELVTNLQEVIFMVDLSLPSPADTELYYWATNNHGATVLDGAQLAQLVDWIQAAMDTVIE
jgi:hypothetical protein